MLLLSNQTQKFVEKFSMIAFLFIFTKIGRKKKVQEIFY